MLKKRQKPFKQWQTREFFISSMLVILVISGTLFGAWMLLREQDPNHLVESEEWLNDNIWKVESYKEKRNGLYDVYLLRVEPAYERSFEALKTTFNDTKYNVFNSYTLADGVNCQGMTCYLADWCERNYCEYSVAWTQIHTFIFIKYNGAWYKFDFDVGGASIEEVSAKYVTKGMTLDEYT